MHHAGREALNLLLIVLGILSDGMGLSRLSSVDGGVVKRAEFH
jgi:hypothetical protein